MAPCPSSTSWSSPPPCPRCAPIAGLDLGEKTIGVAVSDATRTVASPLELIRKAKFSDDAAALFKLMSQRAARRSSSAFR